MTELRELARKLLHDGLVQVVIGYEEGPGGVRPAFVTQEGAADSLVFDSRCVHNLSAYLNQRRKHIVQLGRPAIVAKGCDIRSIAGLIREKQIKREDIVIIGVRCGGVQRDPASKAALSAETVSDRCGKCDVCEPTLVDYLIGEAQPTPPISNRREEIIAKLQAMSAPERREFWNAHFANCIRCYACREACPMCFCVQCTADKATPQWIDPSATTEANRAWQMMRVFHQAGRCVDCMECERACPVNIPLGLLGRYVAESVENRFDYKASQDPTIPTPLSTFTQDDGEDFIL